MLNGILVIRKEPGFTSHDVVAKLRGICRQKKAGHTGTLDPNASGVLPVCLGNATKLCDMLTDKSKEYIAELILGKTTDTQDIWGKVLTDSGDEWRKLSGEEIREAVLSFQGRQLQVPPMYSALKVNGKKLYELARAGIEVERAPREIEIEKIEILPPGGAPEKEGGADAFSALPKLRIRVICSKGTYIRTLCKDIGEKLGCGAVMSSLARIRAGRFSLEKAHTLSEVEALWHAGELEKILIPTERCFAEYPAVTVSEKGQRYLENGNELSLFLLKETVEELLKLPEETALRVYGKENVFYGVYLLQKEKRQIKPWKMFLPE